MPGSEEAMASSTLPLLLPPAPEQNSPPPQQTEAPPQRPNPEDVAFHLWPPTQPTRDAIVSRVAETLSSPSALSRRYGRLPLDEATSVARAIEQEEYASTVAAASASDDGADVLQAYARGIARRMVDSVYPRTSRDRGYLQPKTPEVSDVSPSFDPEVERTSSF